MTRRFRVAEEEEASGTRRDVRQSGILSGLRLQKAPFAQVKMTVLVDTSIWSLALRRKRRDLSPLEQRNSFTRRNHHQR